MRQVGIRLLQSNLEFDIEYTYLVDDALIQNGAVIRGSFVDVPFGRRKQLQTGVVWSIGSTYADSDCGKIKLKPIAGLSSVRPPLSASEMELAEYLRDRCFCALGDCIKCMVPPRAPKGRQVKYAELSVSPEAAAEAADKGTLKNIRQIRILELLAESGALPVAELARSAGCGPGVVETLAKRGYISIQKRRAEAEEHENDDGSCQSALPTYDAHVLNEEQQKAYDFLTALIRKGEFAECLLHGVTGSGKTELYMQLISDTIQNGGAALLLVPEISLTPQMTAHFNRRFQGNVAVLHSRLSDGERSRQWSRIKNGEVSIAIGARSAVFAPFEKLKLIILDEEHEMSYKSEDADPRYHAADVAAAIGRIRGITVVYGSATPRVDTYYRAVRHEIYYLPLKQRANRAPLPEVILEDMREARERGAADLFSLFGERLKEALQENYAAGKQAMLFVHRRGYARQLVCTSCGSIMKCGKCNLPMTYHEQGARLICHYCGRTVPAPTACPACGETRFDRHGAGTQRVADELARLFPAEKILRMDTDTTAGREGHEKILAAFASGEARFLVGTQMIAKGHDFPNVTLVGIIGADSLINMPDYRAEERAFQLFTQMAGRAGRGSRPGKVIIQAYHVDDYAITAACRHSYAEFYKNEIAVRETLCYPPFCSVCVLRFSGEDDKAVYRTAAREAAAMRTSAGEAVEILGPARAEVPKVNGKYRWIITLKSACREDITALLTVWSANGRKLKQIRGGMNLSVSFDGR